MWYLQCLATLCTHCTEWPTLPVLARATQSPEISLTLEHWRDYCGLDTALCNRCAKSWTKPAALQMLHPDLQFPLFSVTFIVVRKGHTRMWGQTFRCKRGHVQMWKRDIRMLEWTHSAHRAPLLTSWYMGREILWIDATNVHREYLLPSDQGTNFLPRS